MTNSQSCIVTGAGIGGLTAAIALAQSGVPVQLLEQTQQFDQIGAGIQLSPNAMHVLAALGLQNALMERAFEPENISLRDYRTGKAVLSVPIKKLATSRYGKPYLHIHRADLMEVLLEAAKDAQVEMYFGHTVQSYSQTESQIQVTCSNKQFFGDLLIGADGINSTIRKQMIGAQNARFTGQVAWRGIVPSSNIKANLIPPDANSWLGPGGHFVSYYLRSGGLINFVAIRECSEWSEESWHVTGDMEQLRQAFSDWDSPIITLLEACNECYLWGLFDRDPEPRWSDQRATLLGDACHPMLPFVAQGAAMAIEDAFVLSKNIIDNGENYTKAFASYELTRRPRTTKMQRLSQKNAKTFHLRNSVSSTLRNSKFALANAIPALTYSQLDPIFNLNVTST